MGFEKFKPSGLKTHKLDVPVVNITNLNPGQVTVVPFDMEQADIINRISLYVGATQAAQLLAVGIYDSTFNLAVSSEVREVPLAGLQEIALPDTYLTPGRYYVAVQMQSTANTATIGDNPYVFGALANPGAFPLPNTLTGATSTTIVPSVTVKGKEPLRVKGLFAISTMPVAAWAINPVDSSVWGTAGGYFQRSVDSGVTWTQMMAMPALGAESPADIVIDNSKVYLLTSEAKLWKSTDLTAAGTWADISCPTRNVNAKGRPYGLVAYGGYIFQGEYSQQPNELAGGPKILRYDPVGLTWVASIQMAGARHIHSFSSPGPASLWVSVGDAGYGNDIGIWRLTSAQIVAGGPDTWSKWTSPIAPNTNHYPVDFLVLAGTAGVPDGVYGTSDRPGKHVLYSKTTGNVGYFNLSAQIFQPLGGPAGETVRGLAQESGTKNLYWITAETTDPAIYMAKPPYVQGYKVYQFPAAPPFVGRTLQAGTSLMNYMSRWSIEKFAGQ